MLKNLPSKKNDSISSIKKYKNKREFNIGLLMFVIVFLYLIVTIVLYVLNDKIAIYEVREGSIIKDYSYTGFIVRDEKVVTAKESGYISYYQNEKTKVHKGMDICAITKSELEIKDDTEEINAVSVNAEIQAAVVPQIQNYNNKYHPSDFSSVYSLKNDLTASMQEAYDTTKTEKLASLIAQSGMSANTYQTDEDGVVVMTVDGYEGTTKDSFTESCFDRSEYESKTLTDQTQVSKGYPAYKLVTGEEWSVIIKLDEENATDFMQKKISSVRVRIDKDSETMWADFSVIEKGGDYYGCLDFYSGMIRYAKDRYLNVELILEDESGLKIPKSACVESDFYVIPLNYVVTKKDEDGNSSIGFNIREPEGGIVFRKADIFHQSEGEDGEEGEAYIKMNDKNLTDGVILEAPDTKEKFKIHETKKLPGVYNVNVGYAIFRKITILCESDEYYIVKGGEVNGLYNYDHIVQNGSDVQPDDVIFQQK